MKILYHQINPAHRPEPLPVAVTRFETSSFPVRIRQLRSDQTGNAGSPSPLNRLVRRESSRARRVWQGP